MVPPRIPAIPPAVKPSAPQFEPDETMPKALPISMVAVSLVFALILAILLYLLFSQRPSNNGSSGTGQQTPESLTMGATGVAEGGQGDSAKDGTKQNDVSADPSQKGTEAALPPVPADQSTGVQEIPSDASQADSNRNEEVVLPIRRQHTPSREAAASLEGDASGKNPFDDASGDGDVVYVIDCSSSMAGDPFMRVQRSLCDAIQKLDGKRKFAVIFFNSVPVVGHYSQRLTAASARNKRDAVNWIQSVHPGGGTDPSDSLFIALQLRPDRVVVLSDGEFSPDVVALVTQINHRGKQPIRIDCIGLTEDVQTLRDLAHQNAKGVYYQAK